jgi:hypothetical protein
MKCQPVYPLWTWDLNEFRLDLLDYIKRHPELERTPMGLHAVAHASADCPPGGYLCFEKTVPRASTLTTKIDFIRSTMSM